MGGHDDLAEETLATIVGESITSNTSTSSTTTADNDNVGGGKGSEMNVGEVVFKDKKAFEAKRRRVAAGGTKNLQIISDFDFTMTKFRVNGERGASCHMVISKSGLLTEEFHATTSELRAKYYPMEVDMSMSTEERETMMVEWVVLAHEAMNRAGLSKSMIAKAVSKANLALRPRQGDLFKWVDRERVPLLLFSAGIADVLEEIIKQRSEEPLPSTCKVISNRMKFDEDGALVGFTGPTFHVFNKNASSALDSPYFKSDEVKRRQNVLLIGDSLGDPGMAQGIGAKEILKIGFLNDKVEERLQAYLDSYDAVILGDGGFDFVLGVLDGMTS